MHIDQPVVAAYAPRAWRLQPAAARQTAMAISPKTTYDIEGRPFYATEDGKGKAVKEIFA